MIDAASRLLYALEIPDDGPDTHRRRLAAISRWLDRELAEDRRRPEPRNPWIPVGERLPRIGWHGEVVGDLGVTDGFLTSPSTDGAVFIAEYGPRGFESNLPLAAGFRLERVKFWRDGPTLPTEDEST